METPPPDDNVRVTRRRSALAEINVFTESWSNVSDPNIPESFVTPSASPDELIIQQRGPRQKPITWSPVDYNKIDLLSKPRDKTPERFPVKEVNPRLRRRLALSPGKNPAREMGEHFKKKLRTLQLSTTDNK